MYCFHLLFACLRPEVKSQRSTGVFKLIFLNSMNIIFSLMCTIYRQDLPEVHCTLICSDKKTHVNRIRLLFVYIIYIGMYINKQSRLT